MVEMWIWFAVAMFLIALLAVIYCYALLLYGKNKKLTEECLKLKGYVKIGDAWHITTKTMIEDAKQALGEERVKKIVEYAIKMYEQQEKEAKE